MKGKIEVAELLTMLQFQGHPRTTTTTTITDHRHFQEQDPEPPIQEKGGGDNTVPSDQEQPPPGMPPPPPPSLGELSASSEEENDGFRTPTSTVHRIPAATECPPAPRKPTTVRPFPMKRRAMSTKVIPVARRRLHQFEEFEVLIPPNILATFLSRIVNPPRDERK